MADENKKLDEGWIVRPEIPELVNNFGIHDAVQGKCHLRTEQTEQPSR